MARCGGRLATLPDPGATGITWADHLTRRPRPVRGDLIVGVLQGLASIKVSGRGPIPVRVGETGSPLVGHSGVRHRWSHGEQIKEVL